MEPGAVMPDFWELNRKPRLLVVEDDNDVGNLLKLCFTDQGMDVMVTVMGREGLALFSTQLFDLVMLDVNLPDIDGFEVMRVIKTSSNKNVPVYFLTQKTSVPISSKGSAWVPTITSPNRSRSRSSSCGSTSA